MRKNCVKKGCLTRESVLTSVLSHLPRVIHIMFLQGNGCTFSNKRIRFIQVSTHTQLNKQRNYTLWELYLVVSKKKKKIVLSDPLILLQHFVSTYGFWVLPQTFTRTFTFVKILKNNVRKQACSWTLCFCFEYRTTLQRMQCCLNTIVVFGLCMSSVILTGKWCNKCNTQEKEWIKQSL